MQTIDQLILASCQKHSAKNALQNKYAGNWKGMSYQALADTVEKLAAGLRKLGLPPQSHIALLGSSSPRWVVAYLAILRAACIAIPIDKELKAAELRHILNDSDAQAVFCGQTQVDMLFEIIDNLPNLQKLILLDLPLPELSDNDEITTALDRLSSSWSSLVIEHAIPEVPRKQIEGLAMEALSLLQQGVGKEGDKKAIGNFLTHTKTSQQKLLKEGRLLAYKNIFHEPNLPANDTDPHDPAVILYTSGTTGRSKGAVLSHWNIVSNIQAACDRFQLDSSIRTLSFLPINHVFEQVCGILLPLSLGGQISFAESLKKLGDNLAEVKPSFLLGVPAVYRLLLDRIMKNIEAKTLSRLLFKFPLTRKAVTLKVQKTVGKETTFISGGAALDPAIAAGFQALGLTLLQGYGITETAPIISAENPFKRKTGTVGQALDGVEIKIDRPNEEGEGEILVRGPNVMLGYYKNDQATSEVIKDGWYHTGDLGRFDTDNMLSICGRVKNLIVTPNGKNVYPEEVENQLLKSPYIAEIMVYGHKISPTAEDVYAVIFPDEEHLFEFEKEQNRGPLKASEVEAVIRREVLQYGKDLADYKRIKKFKLREDEFPKTTTRKIKRYVVEPEISIDGEG